MHTRNVQMIRSRQKNLAFLLRREAQLANFPWNSKPFILDSKINPLVFFVVEGQKIDPQGAEKNR